MCTNIHKDTLYKNIHKCSVTHTYLRTYIMHAYFSINVNMSLFHSFIYSNSRGVLVV